MMPIMPCCLFLFVAIFHEIVGIVSGLGQNVVVIDSNVQRVSRAREAEWIVV